MFRSTLLLVHSNQCIPHVLHPRPQSRQPRVAVVFSAGHVSLIRSSPRRVSRVLLVRQVPRDTVGTSRFSVIIILSVLHSSKVLPRVLIDLGSSGVADHGVDHSMLASLGSENADVDVLMLDGRVGLVGPVTRWTPRRRVHVDGANRVVVLGPRVVALVGARSVTHWPRHGGPGGGTARRFHFHPGKWTQTTLNQGGQQDI